MSIRNLDPLFDPRSIAVFGASRRDERAPRPTTTSSTPTGHEEATPRPCGTGKVAEPHWRVSGGGIVVRNLRNAGNARPVHAVNPHGGAIDGVAMFASIAALPEVPGLAVICTPPETIPALIAELGAAGTRATIASSRPAWARH